MSDRPRINLTPLLDVLLLMVFAFQMQSRLLVQDARTTAGATVAQIDRLRADTARLSGQYDRLLAEKNDLEALLKEDRLQALNLARMLNLAYSKITQNEFYQIMIEAGPAERKQVQAILDKIPTHGLEAAMAELVRSGAMGRKLAVCHFHLASHNQLVIEPAGGPKTTLTLPENPAAMRQEMYVALQKAVAGSGENDKTLFILLSWADVLKSRKDQVDGVLGQLILADLRAAHAGRVFHYVREGYRP